MAKSASSRIKVFQAQFGFFDSIVAAPSQAAALRAWGTHQNLFASGDATQTTEAAAVAAALEHPETPLRRAVGSTDPFQLEPANLPKVPDAPKRADTKVTKKAATALTEPPADRKNLDAAEASIQALAKARKREEVEFRERQDQLRGEQSEAQDAYVEARQAAEAALLRARRAYRKAGGKD